jgi:hypothetical protein
MFTFFVGKGIQFLIPYFQQNVWMYEWMYEGTNEGIDD